MHGSGIQIWFFIGVLLLVYGLLILGYGIFELATGCYPAGVQLTSLHTPIWWALCSRCLACSIASSSARGACKKYFGGSRGLQPPE